MILYINTQNICSNLNNKVDLLYFTGTKDGPNIVNVKIGLNKPYKVISFFSLYMYVCAHVCGECV